MCLCVNSDATRQVPHAQRLLHRETTTVVAAKPNGALAALAEATLAASKGDVAQGEAAVPARGRRQRRDGATRRGAIVGGRAARGGGSAKLGCLATSRWPLPCWPRARGRGTVDGFGTGTRAAGAASGTARAAASALAFLSLRLYSTFSALRSRPRSPLSSGLASLYTASARACAADRSLFGM